jgi:esterase/lipase
VKLIRDYEGRTVRLTDERLEHILERRAMAGMEREVTETIESPTLVVQSRSDPQARLHYRFYVGTRVGDKFLCVIVMVGDSDAFVLTAYLTDRPKLGDVLWRAE